MQRWRKAHAAEQCLRPLAATVQAVSEQIGARGLTDGNEALRITPQLTAHENWQLGIAPDVQRLAHELVQGAESLDAIEGLFDDIAIPQADAQALLDVRRARRRLVDQAGIAHAFLDPPSGTVRWVEWARSRRGDRGAAVCAAPIDVGPLLKRILWRPLPGTVCTSATLSGGGRFSFFLGRHGLDEPTTQIFPSPFDYANQVLLGLPRYLPTP